MERVNGSKELIKWQAKDEETKTKDLRSMGFPDFFFDPVREIKWRLSPNGYSRPPFWLPVSHGEDGVLPACADYVGRGSNGEEEINVSLGYPLLDPPRFRQEIMLRDKGLEPLDTDSGGKEVEGNSGNGGRPAKKKKRKKSVRRRGRGGKGGRGKR